MMAAGHACLLAVALSVDINISHKKAQKAPKPMYDTQPSPLIQKLLNRNEVSTNVEINRLAGLVRETSFEIHRFLRSGHLERVYENALAPRLKKVGVHGVQQHPLDVSG